MLLATPPKSLSQVMQYYKLEIISIHSDFLFCTRCNTDTSTHRIAFHGTIEIFFSS